MVPALQASETSLRLHIGRDLGMAREPAIALRLGELDQLLEDPEARAIGDDMRMHGQQKEPAIGISSLEFAAEDIEDRFGWRIGPKRLKAVHVEVDRVVANPLDRQFD